MAILLPVDHAPGGCRVINGAFIMDLIRGHNERSREQGPTRRALRTPPAPRLDLGGADNLVNRLVEIGLLREITGYARKRRFRFDPYLRLFEEPGEVRE